MSAASLLVFASACGDDPQLVVVVDTDLPTPAQMRAEPSAFAPAAAFDRVRVEMLFEGQTIATPFARAADAYFQEFVIGPDTAWPITFGMREGVFGRKARMLITLYRSDNVESSLDTLFNVGPTPRLAIERYAIVEVPVDGKETVRVVLHGDCIGRPADLPTQTTCIDDPAVMRDAAEDIEHPAGVPEAVAGTWSRARIDACVLPAPSPDAVCVPGGLALRGDELFGTLGDIEGFLDSAPRHLVSVRAFYMDRMEVTVGRFRELFATLDENPPLETSVENPGCTWTTAAGPNEDLPINCVPNRTAEAYCRARGGELPTDAQWEIAARGRGTRGPYVWGRTDPACCAARIAETLGCPVRVGPSKGGSFADPASCDGRADISVDGVLDLAGNVREIVRDGAFAYDDEECKIAEATGILEEPVCEASARVKTARGASFRSSFDSAKASIRSRATISDDVGFRCVHRGVP
jgi:formylglycine-generating enzyme required for sulfatase activity